ncbi:MAG: hypothetical protein LBS19_13165 [Clostridiales bacterium]|jgi:hypothetical protein|nr:hypothetical protein [Clostridiales bacterium]
MAIRPVDMQALLPRTAETAKTTANENSRPLAEQHRFIEQNQRDVYNEQRSVIQSNKTEGQTVDKDGRGSGTGQGGSKHKRRNSAKNQEQANDTTRGRTSLLDLKL